MPQPPAGAVEQHLVNLSRHHGPLGAMLAKPTDHPANASHADPVKLVAKFGESRIGVITHCGANDPVAATSEFFGDDNRVASPTG